MASEELLKRISIDSNGCFGRPCIRSHRIWVSLVLDLLASGETITGICENYGIEEADILACIAYGAEMARERFVEILVKS
jgi:uncharacterized protein (DUF433 family)